MGWMAVAHSFVSLLLLCVSGAAGGDLSSYHRLPQLDLPWLPNASVVEGGLAAAAKACEASAQCSAFTSAGALKECPGGRCTCELSPTACPEHAVGVDLYLKGGSSPPREWTADIAGSSMLYDALAPRGPSVCYQPEVGNGYLATVPGWDAVYIAGLFNGRCGSVHKARLPSPLMVEVGKAKVVAAGVHLREAVFRRLWEVEGGHIVEQRFFAHRVHRHALVMQLVLRNATAAVPIEILDSFDPNSTRLDDAPGNNCAGTFTRDFVFHEQPSGVYVGATTLPNDDGEVFTVTMARDPLPQTLEAHPGVVYTFVTTLTTSLPGDTPATRPADGGLEEHIEAWAKLTEHGIEVWEEEPTPETTRVALGGLGLNYGPSGIAAHVNSSLYYLRSSVRADWTHGVSPGGLATQNYNGAVFFDMDWYLAPAVLLLHPELSASMMQYRFQSLNASRAIAASFGYKGVQYAWTAAYLGHPFGCCSGKGELEDCLEQHVTGDVAVAVWQHFLATNDTAWLRTTALPILRGVSEWVASRGTPVTAPNGTLAVFNISGILPVDEWCVGSGCGCETPGVTNDAQTNAVLKLAIENYLSALDVLGIPRNATENRYAAIAQAIPIMREAAEGRHSQFTSPTCPGGIGGKHYTARHTVCPEDVMYLTFPLGDALSVPPAVTEADYKFYAPRTCQENAGMTTPIHTITQALLLGEGRGDSSVLEGHFNRSMHAAAYGAYAIRNEVDKHPNIIGAEFDNTHFLTGNGGFLQIFLYGFAGLRVTDAGLKLRRPYIPRGVGGIRLHKVKWQGTVMTITCRAHGMTTLSLLSGAVLCLTDAAGKTTRVQDSVSIDPTSFSFPATLSHCS